MVKNVGDILPGKTGPVSGWKKSGAVKFSEMHGSKCMSAKGGNAMGSHKRLSGKQSVTRSTGKHHQLHNAENALGSSVRTFKHTLGEVAPKHISGSGSKHSKDL